ncbi:MAG: hypothetical protein ABR499_08175 [Gemmatimonadaceae bacterium]
MTSTIIWERDAAIAQPVFFPVSIAKLLVMSVFTIGLYELYWFYENWKLVQARTRKRMMPFWRAFFALIWAEPLFKRVAARALDEGVRPVFSPSPMAGLFILLTLSFKLPDPYSLVCFLSVIPLLRVQRAVIEINRRAAPDAPVNAKFSALNVAAAVIGGLVLALIILGSFLPE